METNLLISGRSQANEPTPSDGDVIPLSLDGAGRTRVVTRPTVFPVLSADLTTLNSALTVSVADASNVVVHVKNTGTVALSAGGFTFEGSIDSTDGVNGTWFAIQAVRSNANIIETATTGLSLAVGAGQAYSWEISVNAVRWFRVRCSTAVTASSIATWSALRGSYATEPIPAVQAHAITGTVATTVGGTVATTVSSGNVTVSGTVTNTPAVGTTTNITTAATTNATLLKGSAGTLTEISVFNPTAAVIYVKIYNKVTAPTVGTDVPVVVIPVAVNAQVSIEYGALGKRFGVGISIAVTANPASTDATAVAAGALVSATYN